MKKLITKTKADCLRFGCWFQSQKLVTTLPPEVTAGTSLIFSLSRPFRKVNVYCSLSILLAIEDTFEKTLIFLNIFKKERDRFTAFSSVSFV